MMHRGKVILATFTLLILVGVGVFADELTWLSGLANYLDRSRAAANDLFTSLQQTTGFGSGWFNDKDLTAVFSAPLTVNNDTGGFDLLPEALAYLSPIKAGISPFEWNLGAGIALSFSKIDGSSSTIFGMGPVLSATADLRFRNSMVFTDDPAARFAKLLIEDRQREENRSAVSNLVAAANLAAASAIAQADATCASAQAAYLEAEARHIGAELELGRSSRAYYAMASDAWERAALEADDLSHLAEQFGRAAWITSGKTLPENGTSFSAERLYELVNIIAKAYEDSNPANAAATTAAAPWDLRLAELAVQELTEAPHLSASLKLELLSQTTQSEIFPKVYGTLSFSLPISFFDPDRDKKAKRLSSQKREVMDSVSATATLRAVELEQLLIYGKQRIAVFETMAQERVARLEAWSQPLPDGTTDELAILAAKASLAEIQALLKRQQTTVFLTAIDIFEASGRPLSTLIRATAEEIKAAETAAAVKPVTPPTASTLKSESIIEPAQSSGRPETTPENHEAASANP